MLTVCRKLTDRVLGLGGGGANGIDWNRGRRAAARAAATVVGAAVFVVVAEPHLHLRHS